MVGRRLAGEARETVENRMRAFLSSDGESIEILTRRVLWLEQEAPLGSRSKPADLGVGIILAPCTEF